MQAKRAAIVAAISGVLVMASGTVGYGLGREAAPAAGPQVAGNSAGTDAPISSSSASGTTGRGAAPAPQAADAAKASMPYPGPEFPGMPPYQAVTGDGLHAAGVAYQQTDDPQAKAGQDLVRQAFADAAKQAQQLAEASNVTLGKLLAVSDVKQTQPFYRACVEPLAGGGGAETKAVPPDTPTAAPEPAPDCTPSYSVIVWVFLRYEIA